MKRRPRNTSGLPPARGVVSLPNVPPPPVVEPGKPWMVDPDDDGTLVYLRRNRQSGHSIRYPDHECAELPAPAARYAGDVVMCPGCRKVWRCRARYVRKPRGCPAPADVPRMPNGDWIKTEWEWARVLWPMSAWHRRNDPNQIGAPW